LFDQGTISMEMQNITIRLHPTQDQFDQLVDLQNENLLDVLNESEQAHGFLSVKFSVAQFKEMDENLCVAVALKEDKVVGYLAASTFEFNKQFEILSYMIKKCENLVLNTTPLFSQKLYHFQKTLVILAQSLEPIERIRFGSEHS
jgi:hypothetical protein